MSFQCRLGQSGFDAVAWVRAKTQDLSQPPVVPDSSYELYVEGVLEEMNNWLPLGDLVLGNVGANPPTSPLVTVAGVGRYRLDSAVTGLKTPVLAVSDALYRIASQFINNDTLAASNWTLMDPWRFFRLTPQMTFDRIERMHLFQELDHWGVGYWDVARDIDGVMCLDVWPVPTESGIPILLRYKTGHVQTQDAGGWVIQTIPDERRIQFARLLWAEVLESEAEAFARRSRATGGLNTIERQPEVLRQQAMKLREQIQLELGASTGFGIATS